MVNYLRVVEGRPQSSSVILISLIATIIPSLALHPLQTAPYAPSPSLQRICTSEVDSMYFLQCLYLAQDSSCTSKVVNLPYIQKVYNSVQMKDRWKLLLVLVIVGGVVAVLFLFLGFSFKTVGLSQYGLLQYTFYNTVDRSQTVRQNGNYLVGIDYRFITYPKGMLKHNFNITALTKDKSMITMQGLFLAQLIQSQILNLHFSYGPIEYFKIISKAVQQYFRESLQQFLLKQIISERYSVNSFVSSNVCLNIEAKYSFINCQYVSTGAVSLNAVPAILQPETFVQNLYKKVLEGAIQSQKKLNIYQDGGFDLIQNIEALNADLFLNTSKVITSTLANFTTEGKEIFAGATYILASPLIPVLSNEIEAISIK